MLEAPARQGYYATLLASSSELAGISNLYWLKIL